MAPAVRTSHSHCQGPSCNPWLGNEDSAGHSAWCPPPPNTQIYSPKKRKKKSVKENEKYLRDLEGIIKRTKTIHHWNFRRKT